MTSPTLFDQTETEPTVLAELERVVKGMLRFSTFSTEYNRIYNNAIQDVLNEIAKHKPAEIDKLKQAYSEGYVQTESAESWVNKFNQGG